MNKGPVRRIYSVLVIGFALAAMPAAQKLDAGMAAFIFHIT
jgi:hypothetical protein